MFNSDELDKVKRKKNINASGYLQYIKSLDYHMYVEIQRLKYDKDSAVLKTKRVLYFERWLLSKREAKLKTEKLLPEKAFAFIFKFSLFSS